MLEPLAEVSGAPTQFCSHSCEWASLLLFSAEGSRSRRYRLHLVLLSSPVGNL